VPVHAELDTEPGLGAAPLPSFPGYRALELIARGGFGVVFAATPLSGGPRVAIKLAREDRPDAAARLRHELAALADIGPPHVPAVLGDGRIAGGTPYIVMELIAAPTLADRLVGGDAPIPLSQALGHAVATLRALEAVHARGWVHRDLKPENVFVARGAPRSSTSGSSCRSATRRR